MKTISLLCFFLFFLLSENIFSQEEVWFAKGEQALQTNKLEEAVYNFTKVIELSPSNKNAWYYRGMAYLYLMKFEESLADFNKALELDPKFADAYNNRGLLLTYAEMPDSALSDFNKALELDPKFTQAYINRASAYIILLVYDKAMSDLSEALKLEKSNPAIFNERGRLYYKKKEFENAINDFSKVIELGLKNYKIFYNRGNSYFSLKKYKEALKDYNKALELDSGNTEVLNNRAMAYEMLGDTVNARSDRNKLVKLSGMDKILIPYDSLKFVPYTDMTGQITVYLPQSWNRLELHQDNYDELFVTLDTIKSPSDFYTIGVRISRNRDMGMLFHISEPADIIEFWKGSAAKNAAEYYKYDILTQKMFNRGEMQGLLNRVNLKITKDIISLGMYELILAKKDVLTYIYFQCPEVYFPYFQKIFDKAIETLELK